MEKLEHRRLAIWQVPYRNRKVERLGQNRLEIIAQTGCCEKGCQQDSCDVGYVTRIIEIYNIKGRQAFWQKQAAIVCDTFYERLIE